MTEQAPPPRISEELRAKYLANRRENFAASQRLEGIVVKDGPLLSLEELRAKYLNEEGKRFVGDMCKLGASTARAIVDDDGVEYAIDLITDRLKSVQSLELDGRYPSAAAMYELIDQAHNECEEVIRENFGEVGRVNN